MKSIVVLAFFAVALTGCYTEMNETETKVEAPAVMENTEKLRHVVMFKFKDDAPQEGIDLVVNAFVNLKNEIPEIKGLEWGTNNSPENLNNGFTHCFTLTFDDEAGREVYLPHPAHKAFGGILGPYLDKVMVIDYTTK